MIEIYENAIESIEADGMVIRKDGGIVATLYTPLVLISSGGNRMVFRGGDVRVNIDLQMGR